MSERGFRALVIASLALNIFVIGGLAGGAVIWIRSARPVAVARLPLAGEELPKDERTAFRKALNETRRQAHQTVLDGQQARIDAASSLGQETLDVAALSAALARAREADVAVRALVEQRAVAFATTLSPEERRLLASGFMRREVPKPATPK